MDRERSSQGEHGREGRPYWETGHPMPRTELRGRPRTVTLADPLAMMPAGLRITYARESFGPSAARLGNATINAHKIWVPLPYDGKCERHAVGVSAVVLRTGREAIALALMPIAEAEKAGRRINCKEARSLALRNAGAVVRTNELVYLDEYAWMSFDRTAFRQPLIEARGRAKTVQDVAKSLEDLREDYPEAVISAQAQLCEVGGMSCELKVAQLSMEARPEIGIGIPKGKDLMGIVLGYMEGDAHRYLRFVRREETARV